MNKSQNGYITLIATLIAGAVATAVAVSLLLLGLGSSRNGLVITQSEQAMEIANSCSETALQNLVVSHSYSGSGSLSINGNSCTFTAVNNGSSFQVESVGTVGTVVRKNTVFLNNSGVKWQEVP
jgi:hypothetical protein